MICQTCPSVSSYGMKLIAAIVFTWAGAANAGTITGFAVDLNGDRLPALTVTVTGGGVTVTDADGRFTITTPNVRPVTLTLSGEGSQTTTLTNLDGFAAHNLSVIVPAESVPTCASLYPHQLVDCQRRFRFKPFRLFRCR